jgi:hypothetical protein
MNIADFFVAINGAGIRLAAVDGQLELRGGAITREIEGAAAEHKATILAMLQPEVVIPRFTGSDDAERAAIVAEGNGQIDPATTARVAEAFDKVVADDGFRADHDWRDWRLEWLLNVGQLCLRLRDCSDAEVVAVLKPLQDATPRTREEWLVLGGRITDAENQLRQQGKLPTYPWPSR